MENHHVLMGKPWKTIMLMDIMVISMGFLWDIMVVEWGLMGFTLW